MILLDDFVTNGNDYESFAKAISDFAENTQIIKLRDCELEILSCKEKLSDGSYVFYKISPETLLAFNGGGSIPITKLKPKSTDEEVLFYEMSHTASGMLLKVGTHLLFVAEKAVPTLAARAEIGGASLLNQYSLARNLFIAEGLFSAFRRNEKKEKSTLIFRKQTVKGNPNVSIRKVFSIRGSRFEYTNSAITKYVIDDIINNNYFGRIACSEWSITHCLIKAHIDLLDVADRIKEKYGVPLIPGFTFIDSDIGQCSYTIRFTYRLEGATENMILDEKIRNHTVALHVSELIEKLQEFSLKDFEKLAETLAAQKLVSVGNRRKAIDTYKTMSKQLQIQDAVGHATLVEMQAAFEESLRYEKEYSLYDISAAFLMGPPADTKGYACTKYAQKCAFTPYSCMDNIEICAEDE